MEWYWIMSMGFCCGVYVTSAKIRHVVNVLTVKLLHGFIWIFKATDHYYEEPEVEFEEEEPEYEPYEPITRRRVTRTHDGKVATEVSADQLKHWMNRNPELTLSRRR